MSREVKLYIFNLDHIDEETAFSLPFITEEDIEQAKRFKFLHMQKQNLVSTYFKKKYCGDDIFVNKHGKPLSNSLYFNISHSHNLVVLATSEDNDIGVDVEEIKHRGQSLREYISSELESKYITDDEKFFEVWTSKESLCKAEGSGLSTHLSTISAFPFDGAKEYKGEIYRSKIMKYRDYVISVTLKGVEEFEIETIHER